MRLAIIFRMRSISIISSEPEMLTGAFGAEIEGIDETGLAEEDLDSK